MITKAFTPENGAKAFTIMETAAAELLGEGYLASLGGLGLGSLGGLGGLGGLALE
jgi:hypothetical protein